MGLRARWTLALVGTSVALVLLIAGATEWARHRVVRAAVATWESERAALLDASLRERARAAQAALTALLSTADLIDLVSSAASSGDGARRVLTDWAGAAAARADVDEILVLDPEGRVLSSAVRAGGAGHVHPRADDLVDSFAGVPLVFDAADGERPRWMVGVADDLPRSVGRVIVAVSLEAPVLDRLRESLEIDALRWGPPRPARGEVRFPLPAGWQPGTGAFLTWDPGQPVAARELAALRGWIAGAGALALLVALLTAPWIAAGLGRPLEQMAAAVGEIGRGARHPRLPDGGPPEIASLRRAIQQLARDLDAAEARIRQAERRAAWRDIARRVAHEIRNALSPLSLAVDNVETAVARDDEAARRALETSLRTARDQLGSLDRLVTEFRDFARQPRLEIGPLHVRDLLDAAIEAARATNPDTRFSVDATTAPDSVHGDVEQLRRALHNLLKNAAEAAPTHAVDLVATRCDDPAVWAFEVRDRGPGLDASVRSRLGDPYVTTKASGTGLGLPVTLGIVEAHGGRVRFDARDGGGLVVRVELPRVPEARDETEGGAQ